MTTENLVAFACPHCNQEMEAPFEMAGQTVECPTCKEELIIPSPVSNATKKRVVIKPAPNHQIAPPPATPTPKRLARLLSPMDAKTTKTFLWGGGIVLSVIILIGIVILLKARHPSSSVDVTQNNDPATEALFWRQTHDQCRDADTTYEHIQILKAYLLRFPNGPHAKNVQTAIEDDEGYLLGMRTSELPFIEMQYGKSIPNG